MTLAGRARLHVTAPLMVVSAAAWVLIAFEPTGMSDHCSMANMQASPLTSLTTWMGFDLVAQWALAWASMLAAMMVPMLAAPLRHVCERSFTRRRLRSGVLFVAGYTAIWMVTGGILLPLTQGIKQCVPGPWVPVALVTVTAIMWQFSPMKQQCLNRNHAHSELAAFGWAADRDALRFGWNHGLWCVGSCWALMMLPMLVSRGHFAVMAVVTAWLFCERLDRPMPPRWRLRGPARAVRMIFAQLRMQVQRIAGSVQMKFGEQQDC
jgi:predicted metal-binding membrane protein